MATGQIRTILPHLRKLVARSGDQTADRELLRRFSAARDENAFAEIVRRHGPMLLRVCQRVLHSVHDAEDICQAAFLLLAQKAVSIRWRDSVAGWLFQTAYRLSLKARTKASRRKHHETRAKPPPPADPVADVSVRELQAILDDELTRLPEKYRAPILLCCLEGKSRDEAARYLGWKLTTIKDRLEQGRERLRVRLARRGVLLATALTSTWLVDGAASAGCSNLVPHAIAKAALSIASGQATLASLLPAPVAALAKGVTTTMFVSKVAILLVVGLLVVGLALGVGAAVIMLGHSQEAAPYTVSQNVLVTDGPIEVKEGVEGGVVTTDLYIRDRGPTFVGRNYQLPELRRLATAYYHTKGPAGVVLGRFDWFPGPTNTHWADGRLPASQVGLGAVNQGALPMGQLVGLWSEPPYAVVGMWAGTLASYARPFQHVHFYDRHPEIRRFSLPEKGQPTHFYFLHDALERGAAVRVFSGKERPTLANEGPQRFYHALFVESVRTDLKVVSEELLTKEAMALYFEKLVPEGILCVHISNRYYDLAPIVADVANSLGLVCKRALDSGTLGRPLIEWRGHSTSAWVVVAREPKYLDSLKEPSGYREMRKALQPTKDLPPYWDTPESTGNFVWTDKGPNSPLPVWKR